MAYLLKNELGTAKCKISPVFHIQSKKKAGESVKVIIRCRPMNEKEVGQGFERCVSLC